MFPADAHPDAEILILGSLPGRKFARDAAVLRASPKRILETHCADLRQGVIAALHATSRNTDGQPHCAMGCSGGGRASRQSRQFDRIRIRAGKRLRGFLPKPSAGQPHLFQWPQAEELYRRFVLPGLSAEFAALRYVSMPSTSPAHAGMPFAEKLVRWKKIKEKAP